MATGVMTTNCLAAAELLAKDGHDVSVVHFHTIKPLDEEAAQRVALVLASERKARELGRAQIRVRSVAVRTRPPWSFEVFAPSIELERGPAPTVIASFGSGSARVDVRVYAAGGAAAYLAALRADKQVRQSLGGVLLRNSRVSATPAARAQLAAGQVDTRLLAILATLCGQGPVSIVAFGDSGPGASSGIPLRAAELASPPGAKAGYLPSTLALLHAQQPPYLANSATLARLSDGLQVVRIEFAAPSPLGLLSG